MLWLEIEAYRRWIGETPKKLGSALTGGNFWQGAAIGFVVSAANHFLHKNQTVQRPLYMHEYGHTFDSQIFGLTYLPSIALQSGISAAGDGDHSTFWTERWANRHAARYFGKHFGVDWTLFEPPFDDYPR